MSFFIEDLPDVYIPINDIDTSSFYHHPSSSLVSFDETSSSPPPPPTEDYPMHILWAPRLRTVELPDVEEDSFAPTLVEDPYYEVPYEDEFEEDLQPQVDEINEEAIHAFLLRLGRNQGYERSQRHGASTQSPYPTPPRESYPLSPRFTLSSSMVKEHEDVLKPHSQTINADGYGIVSSRLSPLPHVMVCAPITLYKLLPRWA
ncbi:hypothetical protein Clacol_009476 [Clathrus columnatus]|uniref:Uncharacterized protein n=1 Tax=Clathrus columnatus TaxID=1419009 RepID=A0AAV5AQX7_9AGAM|nr:hypothetical protein Clacol_009476 [Clathrus columnatus]